jgi:hypothetical protein
MASLYRSRGAARALAALVLACLVVVGAAGPAAAHHPEITAEIGCDGQLQFTAVAWAGARDDPATEVNERALSRTNQAVGIAYSVDGGATFRRLPPDPAHSFDAEREYRFSDSFQLPSPTPDEVIVKAQAVAEWANGAARGGPRSTPPLAVPDCARDDGGVPGDESGAVDDNAPAAGEQVQPVDPSTGAQTQPAPPAGSAADAGDSPAEQASAQEPAAERAPAPYGQGGTSNLAGLAVGPAVTALGGAGLIVLLLAVGLWARRHPSQS